jgi:hypothetical protein
MRPDHQPEDTNMNARFWILGRNADHVKVTLKPFGMLNWGYSERTDEGWSSYRERIEHQGDSIRLTTCSDGRDCDGRISDDQVFVCQIADLQSQRYSPGAPKMPAWVRIHHSCRDEFAEMAGY